MKTRLHAQSRIGSLRWRPGVWLVFALATFSVGLAVAVAAAGNDKTAESERLRTTISGKEPVILLTGFEPFGKQRLPNSSWEGIKNLDGQQWKGFQLVCKQMPVVWGAPLEHLPEWIAQYQPAAIFSFGQGGAGSFALESVATNERRRKLTDNRGEHPARVAIVPDGPRSFQATSNCPEFNRRLSALGYPTRVSIAAGRYLCEEALYSLEYLKTTKSLTANVQFCHVPPLGTEIGRSLVILHASTFALMGSPLAPKPWLSATALVCGKTLRGQPVASEYVERFVLDTLETWYALHQKETPTSFVAQAKTEDPRRDEVKQFIGHYFSTWSNQDMKGYDGCFLPDAVIQFIDDQGQVLTTPRRQFIIGQTNFHKQSAVRAIEVPESTDIRFEAKLARAVVFWRLTAGQRVETGYDHFTLIKHEGSWRIVNLTFYATAKKIPD